MSSGKEVFFDQKDLIVSKTDLKGRITYANETFLAIADYDEDEVIGQPHNLIRHADMPRCVFKLLWETLRDGTEIFAYVVNSTKNGDFYWVLAHVTPSLDEAGAIVGYHSTRRVPDPTVVHTVIEPLYADLCRIENSVANAKDGMALSTERLLEVLGKHGLDYDEFIASLDRPAETAVQVAAE